MDWQDEPWAWESQEEYTANEANVFRRWALSHGYKTQAPQDRLLQDVVGEPKQQKEVKKSGGGILGGLGKLAELTRLRDVGETMLKPFEWEHEHIGKPVAEKLLSVPGPFIGVGWDEEEAPGRKLFELGPLQMTAGFGKSESAVTKMGMEALASPSTYGGVGAVGVAGKALGAGAKAAKPLLSGRVASQAARAKQGKVVASYLESIAGSSEPRHVLARTIAKIEELTPERTAIAAKAHQQQAGRMMGVTEKLFKGEYGIEETMGKLGAARRGAFATPQYEPIGKYLSKQNLEDMYMQVAKHWSEARRPQNILNTKDALDKMLLGQKWVTPYERRLLGDVFGQEIKQLLEAFTPWQQKAWSGALNVLGIPRVVQASSDISFALRQGIMVAVRHPKEWYGSLKANIRTYYNVMKNPEYVDDVATEYHAALRAGEISTKLEAPGVGGVAAGEKAEPFVGSLLERVPVVGRIIKASEQAYGAAGAKLRLEYAKTMRLQRAKQLGVDLTSKTKTGLARNIPARDLDDIAEMVNYATGRGPIPQRFGGLLSQLFYAPRFTTAKPAWVAKFFNPNTPGYIRKQMAEDMAAFVGANGGVLAMLNVSGLADVEIDPRSSDFGKVRIGQMRFDAWGGWQQWARYVTQLMTGQRKTIGTGEVIGANAKVVAENFVRSKLSPQFAFGADMWLGETYMGEEMSPTPETMKTQAWNRMIPLAIQDIVEATQKQGAMGVLSASALMGIGMQTFETPGQKVARIAKEQFDVEWREISGVPRQRLLAQSPELKAAYDEQMQAAAKWGATAVPKLQAFDSETQAGIKKMIAQGSPAIDIAGYFRDRNTERVHLSSQWFADSPDYDPRDEAEMLLDEIDSMIFPETGTPDEKDQWWDIRDAKLSNPKTLALQQERQRLRFQDLEVLNWLQRYQRAQQVRNQYYQIPTFRGASLEDGRQVQRLINAADAYAGLGMYPDRKTALKDIARQQGVNARYLLLALNAEEIRNPQKRQFKLAHAQDFAMFEPIGLDSMV